MPPSPSNVEASRTTPESVWAQAPVASRETRIRNVKKTTNRIRSDDKGASHAKSLREWSAFRLRIITRTALGASNQIESNRSERFKRARKSLGITIVVDGRTPHLKRKRLPVNVFFHYRDVFTSWLPVSDARKSLNPRRASRPAISRHSSYVPRQTSWRRISPLTRRFGPLQVDRFLVVFILAGSAKHDGLH